MSIENFIPEFWTSTVEVPFEQALVFGQPQIANRKYEGQVSQQGDTVHITSLTAPTVKTYTKGQDIEIEELADGRLTVTVDQGDYFAFGVNDVDKVQAAGDFESPSTRAAGVGLQTKVDTYLGGLLKAGAKNKLTGIRVVDAEPQFAGTGQISAYQLLVKMREKLDGENVPTVGRYVVVSPEIVSALLMDKRYTDLSASGSTEALLNGQVGRATGFDVLVSNNLPKTSGKHHVVAGVSDALTFVPQITETEALRDPKQFRDIVRGLMIYGAKVTRPEAAVVADVTVEVPAVAEPSAG